MHRVRLHPPGPDCRWPIEANSWNQRKEFHVGCVGRVSLCLLEERSYVIAALERLGIQ